MLLWFNKKGVLKEQLDSYGNLPRVGSEVFQIIAYFDDLNLDEDYGAARLVLQRPDFNGSRYPALGMTRVDVEFEPGDADGQSQFFRVGGGPNPNGSYPCYMFDFSSFFDNNQTPTDYEDDKHAILLDTPGLWKAMITLVGNSGVYNVTGTATFNVEGDEGPEEETVLSNDLVLQTFANELSKKLNIRNGIVVLHELPEDPGTSGYTDGQIFYIESDNQFYKLDNGSFVLFNIFNPGETYLTVEEEPFVIPPEDR